MQGGFAYNGSQSHAMLWSGSASSAVDLNPFGFTYSEIAGISGTQQVGQGRGPATNNQDHALLWMGSAGSFVDLNPIGYNYSDATATSGDQQVGVGFGPSTGNATHALLWKGSAASVVDLNPPGYQTDARGVSNGQQVGFGSTGAGQNYALLWTGSAASVIDLNPPGFTQSLAWAVSNGRQVGFGLGPATDGSNHALVWFGTAASVIDLHQFLPPDFSESEAIGIDANGDIVGYASRPCEQPHAFLWSLRPSRTASPTPTPIAVSVKTHGPTDFSINLPLTCPVYGVECRSGGSHRDFRVVVTYSAPVTFNSASLVANGGTISSSNSSGNQITINLTGVTDAQTLRITLSGVTDGTHTGDTVIPMSVLLGDTSGNGAVNASDVSLTKSRSGQTVTELNFRNDVTTNGFINASDVSLAKSKSGSAIP
jgi:hypothetical protein